MKYQNAAVLFFIVCMLIGITIGTGNCQSTVQQEFSFTVGEQEANGADDDSSLVLYLAGAVQGPNPKCDTASVAGLVSVPKIGKVGVAINISSADTAYTALDSVFIKLTPLTLFGSSYLESNQSWYPDQDAGDLVATAEAYTLTETNVLNFLLQYDNDVCAPWKQWKMNIWRMDTGAAAAREYTVKVTVTNKVKL